MLRLNFSQRELSSSEIRKLSPNKPERISQNSKVKVADIVKNEIKRRNIRKKKACEEIGITIKQLQRVIYDFGDGRSLTPQTLNKIKKWFELSKTKKMEDNSLG